MGFDVTPRRLAATAVALALTSATATATAADRAWATPGVEEAARARNLAATGRCAEALEDFDRAVEARSEDATLRRDRGACHEQLNHPIPAIEDYRAYLSMAPGAPDVGPVRARKEALEAAERERTPPAPAPSPAAPKAGGDGTPEGEQAKVPTRGWLVGLHIGVRGWNDAGYAPEPTTSYGIAGGWAYARDLEATARLVLLDTSTAKTSGFGFSLGNTWKVALTPTHEYELTFGGALAYESQKNDFRIARAFYSGRGAIAFRWVPVSSVVLDLGPEVGLGFIQKQGAAQNVSTDEGFALGFHYGGQVSLMWLIGD